MGIIIPNKILMNTLTEIRVLLNQKPKKYDSKIEPNIQSNLKK